MALSSLPARNDTAATATTSGAASDVAGGTAATTTSSVADADKGKTAANSDMLLKSFFSDVYDVSRDAEVDRILACFKLNPYEHLGVRFDACEEDINKKYRQISLLVHPDKCTHPRAKEAFETLGEARKLLQDEAKRKDLSATLSFVKSEMMKEWRKEHRRDDAAHMLAQASGMTAEETYANSEYFHELWKQRVREVLGNREWRKRKLSIRLGEEEKRVEKEEQESRAKAKQAKEQKDEWDTKRDERIGSWRAFQKKKAKKGASMPLGAIPKKSSNDASKSYIRRPAA